MSTRCQKLTETHWPPSHPLNGTISTPIVVPTTSRRILIISHPIVTQAQTLRVLSGASSTVPTVESGIMQCPGASEEGV